MKTGLEYLETMDQFQAQRCAIGYVIEQMDTSVALNEVDRVRVLLPLMYMYRQVVKNEPRFEEVWGSLQKHIKESQCYNLPKTTV